MARKKAPTRPDSFEAAFAELAEQQKKKEQRRRRLSPPSWLDRRVLLGVAVVVVVLVADGVRRENAEFSARPTELRGGVQVRQAGKREGRSARLRERLRGGDVVTTAGAAQATLAFADGSVIVVGPNSEITLRTVEYNRGGRYRDRSFYLSHGECWSAVSNRFGGESEMTVHTPSVVAAVRGTRFYVGYSPQYGWGWVACDEGHVRATTRGREMLRAAVLETGTQWGADRLRRMEIPAPMDPRVAQSFARHTELDLPPSNDPFMQRVEYALNGILDPVLNILGIGRCSWGVGSSNAARRAAALEGMRLLRTHLEGEETYPAVLGLATLEELNIGEKEASRILGQLRGNTLDSYTCLEQGADFVASARAKDRASTLLTLTSRELRVGEERAE